VLLDRLDATRKGAGDERLTIQSTIERGGRKKKGKSKTFGKKRCIWTHGDGRSKGVGGKWKFSDELAGDVSGCGTDDAAGASQNKISQSGGRQS